MPKNSARAALLVFLAAFAFFSVGASSRGLWHNDEHRIAEVAREMSVPGGDWIVPHLNGEVYTHKPPLVPWVAAALHGTLGLDLVAAARAPSILGAALAVLATFLIGRRLYSTSAAIAAAVVLATAAQFDWICRRAQYDPLLTGFTTLSLWFFVRAWFPSKDDEEAARPWRDALLGSLCVGLAAMAKGPVALVFTVPTIVVFALVVREGRGLVTRRWIAWLVALLPAALWLGAAASRGGMEYVVDLVFGHGVGHAIGEDKNESAWFFLIALPPGFAPWTLFAPVAVLASTRWRREGERRADVFVLAWIVVPFVLMSLFPAKRALYLLPLYPACALLVGKLAVSSEARRSLWFRVPATALALVFLVAAGAGVLLCGQALFGDPQAPHTVLARVLNANQALGPARPVLGIVICLAIAWGAWRALPSSRTSALTGLGLAAVSGTLFFAAVWLPAIDPLTSPRAFYEDVGRRIGDAPLARYSVEDFAPNWVLRRNAVPYVANAAEASRFLAKTSGPAYLVVERSTLDETDTAKRRGMPAGARIVVEWVLPLDQDLILLGKDTGE